MAIDSKPFLSDIQTLRQLAQDGMKQGAVTPANVSDAGKSAEVFNLVLASELVCVLRYQRHFYMAQGIHAEPVKAQFHEHWLSEEMHAGKIAERITQLNGEPDFNPAGLLTRAASEY